MHAWFFIDVDNRTKTDDEYSSGYGNNIYLKGILMEQTIEVKVYYEDTDCLGIVYHANYLKYMERGRTEYFNSSGKTVQQLNEEGYYFAVYEIKIKFLKPAKLGDVCRVISSIGKEGSEYRKKMIQRIESNGLLLVEAEVDIICLNKEKQLIVFPKGLLD